MNYMQMLGLAPPLHAPQEVRRVVRHLDVGPEEVEKVARKAPPRKPVFSKSRKPPREAHPVGRIEHKDRVDHILSLLPPGATRTTSELLVGAPGRAALSSSRQALFRTITRMRDKDWIASVGVGRHGEMKWVRGHMAPPYKRIRVRETT
jgi:hypothetical protein